MSYDIYFIKSKDLIQGNLEDFLVGEVSPDDKHYISKEMMSKLKDSIAELGNNFELIENQDENFIEMKFESFEVSIFSSQVVISIPYWIEELDESITSQIEVISQLFIDNGFTGYDQQTDVIFSGDNKFHDSFTQNQSEVKVSLDEFTASKKNSWIMYAIGIFVITLIFVLWKLIF
jgi:hypothetical protein